MSGFSIPLTRIVHENLSIVMCFAFSRRPLQDMIESRFAGDWKYLHKALFEISEERATKACIELALFLRMVDDEVGISEHHKQTKIITDCGKLIMKNGSTEALTFREFANKVIHSSKLEWFFHLSGDPLLISHGRNTEKWLRAEIDIVAVASVCGTLMS